MIKRSSTKFPALPVNYHGNLGRCSFNGTVGGFVDTGGLDAVVSCRVFSQRDGEMAGADGAVSTVERLHLVAAD